LLNLDLGSAIGIIARTLIIYMVILAGLHRLMEGTPRLLVMQGKVVLEHLCRDGIDPESLLSVLREHGVSDISEAEMAVLEIDSSSRVVPAGGITTGVKKPLKFLRSMILETAGSFPPGG
jgi:uncharacterized membrane protein YcaP (DUF421 family)